jgi:hypothetical protein
MLNFIFGLICETPVWTSAAMEGRCILHLTEVFSRINLTYQSKSGSISRGNACVWEMLTILTELLVPSSVPPGIWWDSTLNTGMTTSFHILSNSLFTIIESPDAIDAVYSESLTAPSNRLEINIK